MKARVTEPPSNRLMGRCMRLLKTNDIQLHAMEPIYKGSPLSMVIKTVNIYKYDIKIHFLGNEKQAMLETLTVRHKYRGAIRANWMTHQSQLQHLPRHQEEQGR